MLQFGSPDSAITLHNHVLAEATMTTIIGIDYSGAKSDRNTWVALGRLTSDGALVFDSAQMRRRSDVTELLATTSTPAVAGIDFPFGVPLEFADFLNTSEGIRSMPEAWRIVSDLRLEDFNAARDAFCGPVWRTKASGRCKSLLGKFLASAQSQSQHDSDDLLRHADDARTQPKPGRALACAPVAGIRRCIRRSIKDRGYTSGNDAGCLSEVNRKPSIRDTRSPESLLDRDERRNRILDDLSSKSGVALPNLSELRDDCLINDDCLDAIVAAVAAACWVRNPERFRHPNADELSTARLEGWIYVPQSAE